MESLKGDRKHLRVTRCKRAIKKGDEETLKGNGETLKGYKEVLTR